MLPIISNIAWIICIVLKCQNNIYFLGVDICTCTKTANMKHGEKVAYAFYTSNYISWLLYWYLTPSVVMIQDGLVVWKLNIRLGRCRFKSLLSHICSWVACLSLASHSLSLTSIIGGRSKVSHPKYIPSGTNCKPLFWGIYLRGIYWGIYSFSMLTFGQLTSPFSSNREVFVGLYLLWSKPYCVQCGISPGKCTLNYSKKLFAKTYFVQWFILT